MRGQNAMGSLNVRTARWVTKVLWHGGGGGGEQRPVVYRQTDLFPFNLVKTRRNVYSWWFSLVVDCSKDLNKSLTHEQIHRN